MSAFPCWHIYIYDRLLQFPSTKYHSQGIGQPEAIVEDTCPKCREAQLNPELHSAIEPRTTWLRSEPLNHTAMPAYVCVCVSVCVSVSFLYNQDR